MSEENKKTKKKGPIRFEAIIPITIVVVLIGAYFTLFFDSNLKSGIEWAGTNGNGAEVNVRTVKTSFKNLSLTIMGLQVTDKENPKQNLVEIERIHFGFIWDALLRAKFVVNEASVQGIKAFSTRARPGRVLPVKPKAKPVASSKTGKPSEAMKAANEVKGKALVHTQQKFNDNILGDLAAVAGGVDTNSQLKNVQGQLKAEKYVANLQQELKDKETEWKSKFDSLPNEKEFNQLVDRAKKLKFETKNPAQFAKDLKELDKIMKEADAKIKTFETASNELKKDLNYFNDSANNIDNVINQDIKDLQARLKIPNIDGGDFSKDLFGKILREKLGKYNKYVDMAREYMPPPKKDGEEEVIPQPKERGQGINIKFPVTTGYPLFWLKTAQISSEATNEGFSGDIEGTLKDLTSDPAYINKPTTLAFKGDFPNQGIMGITASAVFDHTTSDPKDTFQALITAFPVSNHTLSNSSDVMLKVNKAMGSASLAGEFYKNELQFDVKNNFNQIDYSLEAKSKDVHQILDGVIKGIPVVNLTASAKGKITALNWKISSNLGQEISRGFKREVQKKVDQAKKQLEKFVNDKISAEKDKLNAEINKVKKQFNDQINAKKKEMDKAKAQAKSEINKQKNSKTAKANKEVDKAKKKVEEEGKKLLKKLGL